MTEWTALTRAQEYRGRGFRGRTTVVVWGRRWVVLTGNVRLTLYAAGFGRDRHLPWHMNISTQTGSAAWIQAGIQGERRQKLLTVREEKVLLDALAQHTGSPLAASPLGAAGRVGGA